MNYILLLTRPAQSHQRRNYTMSDLNNNKKSFNLPSYINTPLFLYQDSRLDRPALLIASFYYSLHTAGNKLIASTDYLCQLALIKKRQLYNIMNLLEECLYIKRSGFTNRKKLEWIYNPKSSITIVENETTALECTKVQELNTSAIQCTKLVQPSALNYCTPLHTDNKVDIKDYKKLTTVNQNPSSSSFFTPKQQTQLLLMKLPADLRSKDLFLEHCQFHIEKQKNDLVKFQRLRGLKNLLTALFDEGEIFHATGFDKTQNKKIASPINKTKTPDETDFKRLAEQAPGYEWVEEWIQEQNNCNRLDQEYFQMHSINRKGYAWVGTWLELKGLKQKQK